MKYKRGILVVVVCILFLLPLVTNDFDIPGLVGKTDLSQDLPTLTGVFDDYGVDTDSDGKFDYLAIDVQVQVTVVGEYTVYIDNLNGSGASINVSNETVVDILSTGTQYITVYLNGEAIHDRGADGPYTVNYVELFFDNGTHWADDYLEYPYTTGAYSYTDFDTPGPTIDDPYLTGVYSEYGVDTNGNGKYDYLAIDVEFNATLTGTYDVYTGELWSDNGTYIIVANSTEFEVLTPGVYTATVYLDGREIYTSGANGPYSVWSAAIQLGTKTDTEFTPILTRYYDYTDFESPEEIEQSTLTGVLYSQGLDTDADGKFNFLAIDVEVNITIIGDYEIYVLGLKDPMGELISVSNSTWWNRMNLGIRLVRVYLSGIEIHNSELNGPYTVWAVGLKQQSISHTLYDVHTTEYFSYTDFQKTPDYPVLTETFNDWAVDTDSNGKYDYLVIQAEVDVIFACEVSITVHGFYAPGNEWIYVENQTDAGYLSVGLHNITIYISTENLFLSEKNGPYTIWSISSHSDYGNDFVYFAHKTAYYEYAQFDSILKMTNLIPKDGDLIADSDVLFSWKTNLLSTTEIYLRPEGGSYTHHTGDDGKEHSLTIEDLQPNTLYEFYAVSVSDDLQVESDEQSFYIGSGVTFDSDSYEFSIDRDYNQWLWISATNYDDEPHRLQMGVESIYPDLFLGFVGEGSMDHIITLDSLESCYVALVVHCQDAMSINYSLPIKLTTLGLSPDDEEIVDYATLELHVGKDIVVDFILTEIADDPHLLTKTFNLTNHGDTLTDFRIFADENLTQWIIWDPVITHLRLETGESVIFKARLEINWMFQGSISGLVFAEAFTERVNTSAEFQGDGELFYGQGDISIFTLFRDWYCVNNPYYLRPLNWPSGLKGSINYKDERLSARITNVWEEVYINGQPAIEGQYVHPGDTIKTEVGAAELTMYDGTHVTIEPVGEYFFDSPPADPSVWTVVEGTANFVVGNIFGRRTTFSVDTPNAVVGVRGTRFSVSYNSTLNETKFLLYDGELDYFYNDTDTLGSMTTDADYGLTYDILHIYNQVSGEYDLIFRNSSDYGRSWLVNQTLYSSSSLGTISVTVGINHTILVAFEDSSGIQIILSNDNGTTWTTNDPAITGSANNPFLQKHHLFDLVLIGWSNSSGTFFKESRDNGLSWSVSKTAPTYLINTIDAYLEVNFELAWDKEFYRPHDIVISINGHVVAMLNNTIPEGTYIFPVDISYFNFGTDFGVGENELAFNTYHLPGGPYVVNTDSRVFIRLTDLAIPVYAHSQSEADDVVKNMPSLLFNTTDVAVYTNRIDCPSAIAMGSTLQLNATVMNIGDNDASEVVVQFFQGDPRTNGTQIGSNQTISMIPAGDDAIVSIPWTVTQDSEYIFVRVSAAFETITSNNLVYKVCSVRTIADAPTVRVIYPNGSEVVQGSFFVTWVASDPNNDELSFRVLYGDGVNWIQIEDEITESYYYWNTTAIDNGQYKILVEVTDGLFTTNDTSDDFFTVDNLVTTTTTVTTSTTTTPTTTTTPHTPWYEQEFLGLQLWIWLAIGSTGIILVTVVIVVKKRRGS